MVGTCTRSCARIRVSKPPRVAAEPRCRVSRQSRARRSHVSACRGKAALRPPCGRAQLVSILIVVGTCTRSCARVRVSRLSRRAEPRAAKPPPHVAALCRDTARRCRVSRRSRLAINRSEEIVFDPSSRID